MLNMSHNSSCLLNLLLENVGLVSFANALHRNTALYFQPITDVSTLYIWQYALFNQIK